MQAGCPFSCPCCCTPPHLSPYLQKKSSRLQMRIFLLNRLRYAWKYGMTSVIVYNIFFYFFFLIWKNKAHTLFHFNSAGMHFPSHDSQGYNLLQTWCSRGCSTNSLVINLFINSLTNKPFSSKSSKHHNSQTARAKALNIWYHVHHPCCVMCHTSHMSHVRWHHYS